MDVCYNVYRYPDTYKKINVEIDRFDATQKEVLELLIDLLPTVEASKQKSSELMTLHHILAKARFNLEAAHKMIPNLKGDYRFKTSLNLLYRAILSDMIGSLYLISWHDVRYQEQLAMQRELDILHVFYLKKIRKLIEDEKHYKEYSPEDLNYEEAFKAANPHLTDLQTGKWLTEKQIRSQAKARISDQNFNVTTESDRIHYLGELGLIDGPRTSVAFIYLSQYQHFTPMMHEFLLGSAEGDIEYYETTLSLLLLNIHHFLDVFVIDYKEDFKARLKTIAKNYTNPT